MRDSAPWAQPEGRERVGRREQVAELEPPEREARRQGLARQERLAELECQGPWSRLERQARPERRLQAVEEDSVGGSAAGRR